jgi:histone acetyltransferase (RNA polymerase elongator complex component)
MARFRLVAIVEPLQRRGYGRQLLDLAEAFALEQGAVAVKIASAPDAVAFYQRLGYALSNNTDQPGSIGIVKRLTEA